MIGPTIKSRPTSIASSLRNVLIILVANLNLFVVTFLYIVGFKDRHFTALLIWIFPVIFDNPLSFSDPFFFNKIIVVSYLRIVRNRCCWYNGLGIIGCRIG